MVSGLRPTRPPKPDDGAEGEGHAAPEPYSFSYAVDDPESGASSSREETQDASGEIVGKKKMSAIYILFKYYLIFYYFNVIININIDINPPKYPYSECKLKN